jgi:hypothetical protein
LLEIISSVEMVNPRMFPINKLPFDQMMPADEKWLPYVFCGKWFKAFICQNVENNTLLSFEIIRK